MKLSGDLYSIEDNVVRFNPDHIIYQAHFPENPITPGVCLMQIAGEMLEARYGDTMQLIKVMNVKFRKPVTPDVSPSFMFNKITFDKDKVSVGVSVEANGIQYARMSLVYRHTNI